MTTRLSIEPVIDLLTGRDQPDPLQAAVFRLADVMVHFSDADLGQPWAWGPHEEGVRFALLGAYQELRELAVRLADERRVTQPQTAAQHVLAQYHAAFRDLQAVLLGIDETLLRQAPAPAEWPLSLVLDHIIGAERGFFSLVHYGLRRQREAGDLPPRLPEREVQRLFGHATTVPSFASGAGLYEGLSYFEALHEHALAAFAGISEKELQGPSLWWEDIPFSLQHRLHRFDAHLRQHTVQVEKTLASLGVRVTESKRLLRLLFNALAEVEGALIGAPGMARQERDEAAAKIDRRAHEISDLIDRARRLEKAAAGGDMQTAAAILDDTPALAGAIDQNQQPLIMTAVYHQQPRMADLLRSRGAPIGLFEAAALGREDAARQILDENAEAVDEYSRDGFTPLQLACYFGHIPLVSLFVEHGAHVNAVSQNDSRLQAIHAAVANNSFTITRFLLAHGADSNAVQAGGFTPLHAAAQNGNRALVRLLLDFGADTLAANEDGKTAVDLASDASIEALLTGYEMNS